MDTRITSPCLPSTLVPSWTSPSGKWDLFGEAIFSPSRQQKKKSKLNDRELKSISSRLFPTNHLKSDEVSSQIEEESGNRILPYNKLKECLESNIVCKKCHSRLLERKLDTKLVSVTEKTIGIATELTCRCNCCEQVIFRTHQPKTSLENKKSNQDSNESYQINCLLVLGFQLVSGGCLSADIILSFLNLSPWKFNEIE